MIKLLYPQSSGVLGLHTLQSDNRPTEAMELSPDAFEMVTALAHWAQDIWMQKFAEGLDKTRIQKLIAGVSCSFLNFGCQLEGSYDTAVAMYKYV